MGSISEMSVPSVGDFVAWPAEQVRSAAQGKTVVLAPGGTSRWYFLEHGHQQRGYGQPDSFRDYGKRALRRTIELADMIFDDGIDTIFSVGFVPGQNQRDRQYNANLSWAYQLLVNDDAQTLYAQYHMAALFRGGWSSLFSGLGATNLITECQELERQTLPNRRRWLIWLTEDQHPIPDSLTAFVAESLQESGTIPERGVLANAYYGRPLEHVDILVGHNKPSVRGLTPPLLTIGDTYFTVTPTYYMDRLQWRHILYDHLFTRHSHYRDYTELAPDVMDELRAFCKANHGLVTGVGVYHEPSHSWRPIPAGVQPIDKGVTSI
jgi:hypothetical protein